MTHPDEMGLLAQGRARGSREPARVLETLKQDAVTDLGGVLSGFWGTIEEQVRLASLAGHDYSAAQDDRMAITALSHRALELATRYREAIEQQFERWQHPKPQHTEAKSLSLMSEGELEIHLAGQQTTELLEHQFLHPLQLMDERLRGLANGLGLRSTGPNPVRPEAAVAAFVGLFGEDDLPPGLRSMVFHQFDKRLPQVLGELYSKTNATLEATGFGFGPAPALEANRNYVTQMPHSLVTPMVGMGEGGWVPEGGMVDALHTQAAHALGAAMAAVSAVTPQIMSGPPRLMAQSRGGEGQPPRYRDIVREQLRTWRIRTAHGAAGWTSADAGAPAGHILGTEDMLSVATMLQGDDPTPFTRALAGDDKRPLAGVIREELLDGVRQLGFDPADTRFSVDEEDAIDLIGILFQSFFEANDLLSRARAMYGRLVVPYLKVALTDDSLFNRRSHPARQLLDALTEACDGNNGETPQDQETLERAENAVNRVVGEFREDQAIFELAATELRDQLDQQRRRSELAERRAAEAIHGRERLQQAREAADAMVASRFVDRPLTASVADFLSNQWRHYLVQTWLRDGSDSPRHLAAIGVGDAMVQVDADAAQARGSAVADQLLALQVPLGECYSSCGLDAAAARDSLARIISALALPDKTRSVHLPPAYAMEPETEDETQSFTLRLAGGTATMDFDPTIAARMRRLRVGQGLRLIDRHGHESAARIAWISPLTSRFLIVNRRGMRKLVVSPEELAAMVANGRAVVRSVDAPFDEAMKQVWQHLNETPAAAS